MVGIRKSVEGRRRRWGGQVGKGRRGEEERKSGRGQIVKKEEQSGEVGQRERKQNREAEHRPER